MSAPVGWEDLQKDADAPSGNNPAISRFINMKNVIAALAFASLPLGLVLGVALNSWSH